MQYQITDLFSLQQILSVIEVEHSFNDDMSCIELNNEGYMLLSGYLKANKGGTPLTVVGSSGNYYFRRNELVGRNPEAQEVLDSSTALEAAYETISNILDNSLCSPDTIITWEDLNVQLAVHTLSPLEVEAIRMITML